MRTLGKPALNMTGRFQKSWGDFGGVRTPASVEYDCILGIANGLPPSIGDHFHPRGDLNRAVMKLDRTVYQKLQPLQPWIDGATPVVEIANVMLYGYPGYHKGTAGIHQSFKLPKLQVIKSATRMLSELKMQFDNVTLAAQWDKYKILVLPEDVVITPKYPPGSKTSAQWRRADCVVSIRAESGTDWICAGRIRRGVSGRRPL